LEWIIIRFVGDFSYFVLVMSKRILIAGGSGFIGTALSGDARSAGYQVVILSRKPGPGVITWDPARMHMAIDQPQFFDAIINLAGANIAEGRWTKRRKAAIYNSRIQSCETLLHYVKKGLLQTNCYLGASGTGYYRNSGDAVVDEYSSTRFPDDWLVKTVTQWESTHQSFREEGIRTGIVRFGIVLSKEGGALKEILKYARFGLLAWFGSGKQYWPWIHIRDVARVLLEIINHENMEGVYLAVAPHPVTNKELTRAVYHFRSLPGLIMPVPRLLMKWRFGEMHSVLFDSCRGFPKRLSDQQYDFLFPDLDKAMQDIFNKSK
jgi:uncharacterized protein (TIGR01777 family)